MERTDVLKQLGFKKLGENDAERFVGTLFGYPTTVILPAIAQFKFVFTIAEEIPKNQLKELQKEFNDEPLLKNRVTLKTTDENVGKFNTLENNSINSGFVLFVELINPNTEQEVYDKFMEMLEQIISSEENIKPLDSCPYCQNGKGDMMVNVNNQLRFVHKTCLDDIQQSTIAGNEERSFNTGYIRGTLGAIAGAVIGGIPALLILYFANYFVWLLFALIPLAASIGWSLMKAKRGIVSIAIIIITTIIVSLAVDVTCNFLILREELSDILFSEVIRYFYMDSYIFGEYLMRDTLLSLVGAVIGIFISWSWVGKTDKGEEKILATVIDEAVPVE